MDVLEEIEQTLEHHRQLIHEEKSRLGLTELESNDGVLLPVKKRSSITESCEKDSSSNKENLEPLDAGVGEPPTNNTLLFTTAPAVVPSTEKDKNVPFREQACNRDSLEERKQSFADSLSNSENPLTVRSDGNTNHNMLRYGEFSPNNPQMRVTAAPYIGIGEYDQRRTLYLQRERADYSEYLSKKSQRHSDKIKSVLLSARKPTITLSKSCQTDIQNIRNPLIHHEPAERELRSDYLDSPSSSSYVRNSRSLTDREGFLHHHQQPSSPQNALFLEHQLEMDKPKSILSNRRTGSPRERLLADLKHSYTPASYMDGFSSYHDSRAEELERERYKREAYKQELRLQIEEKRRLQALQDEQRRREQELDNRRLEQQLLRMQEEAMIEEQRRNHEQVRRHSEDLLRRKQEMQSWPAFRKHTDSESSVLSLRNTNVASSSQQQQHQTKALSSSSSHYSPPVARRHNNPAAPPPPYSFNIPSTSVFAINPSSTAEYNNIGSGSCNHPGTNSTSGGRFDSYYLGQNRQQALNRMDSLNIYDNNYTTGGTTNYTTNTFPHHNSRSRFTTNNAFGRYDSLSRIDSLIARHQQQQQCQPDYQSALSNRMDSLNVQDNMDTHSLSNHALLQRRHSATHQDLSSVFGGNNSSCRKSPKLQRRSSSSNRFDDSLPIPVLKAHSPVAKELKNSVPFNSGSAGSSTAIGSRQHGSDAMRRLEDRWQVPAVQKNIMNHGDPSRDGGQNRSILTQLGAIRMQLQQEQMRMDRTLRSKRDITQSKAVDFH